MKLNKIILSGFTAAVLFAAGCKKEKFDINSNPDSVTDVSVSPAVLLPGAQQATARLVAVDWSFLQFWMGHWARSGSFQSLNEIETFRFGNDFQVAVWNDLYSNSNNYHIMQTKAAATGAGFYEAIGRIMKAHNFGILVDVYNNVPYFEAFRGTASPTPKYDKGADIYKDLFKQIDTAINLLSRPSAIDPAKNPDLASADLVYAGNATNWIKFANTLRLRLLMHLHNGLNTTTVAPGFNVTAIRDSIQKYPLMGAGESAHLNPGFSATKPQPYYRAYVSNESGTQTGDVFRAGEYAIEYYKYNGDPRINRFYVAPAGAAHKGNKFGRASDNTGLYTGDKLSTVRGPGLIPQGAASRAWIITSVESLFLQAEARQRNVLTTGATAKDRLTAAIRESFVWLGLTAAQADTYISNNAGYSDVDYDAAALGAGLQAGGMFTILSQKWFALNSIAEFELWTDYRRTDYVLGASVGYDAGPPKSVDINALPKMPIRLLYPQSEFNYNAANVGAEGAINYSTSKIFWDLN